MRLTVCALLLSIVVLAGCGREEPDSTPAPTPAPTPEEGAPPRLLPLHAGATWSYLVTDLVDGTHTSKTRVVEALEDVGDRKIGITAWRMRVENAQGYSLSWHEDLGAGVGVVRHREKTFEGGLMKRDEYYDAHKLRADETPEHRVTGAAWTETYTESKLKPGFPETTTTEVREWIVEAARETVTVPAGTFESLRVRRTSPTGGTDKVYWFVEGIGVVKELDVGLERIELQSWAL